jgi:hypothetical protein
VETIETGLGRPSDETQVSLHATVHSTGTVNGRDVERTVSHRLPLVFEGGTYRVPDDATTTNTFERTKSTTRERSYGLVRYAGGPLLVVVGSCGVTGLLLARRRGVIPLSAAERDRLSYLDDREEFDEWISEIRLPAEAFELPEAEAASLASLVDFAIDTDNGVVESPDETVFHVVHDGYLYSYRPPAVEDASSGPSEVTESQLSLDEVGTDSRDVDAADDGFPAGMASDGAED